MILLLLALITLGLVYYFGFYQKTNNDNRAYEEAEKAYKTREYNLALSKYKESINTNPKKTDSYIKAAELLILKQKYADAIQVLGYGIGFADDQAKIYKELAYASALNNNLEQAVVYSKNALDANSSTEYVLDYAKYLSLNGKVDDAKETVKKIDGTDNNTQFVKILLSYNDLANARTLSKELITKAPNEQKYTTLDTMLGEMEQANSNKIENYMKLAKFAIENEQYGVAQIILAEVKNANSYYEGSYLYQAFIQIQFRQYSPAVQTLRTAYLYAPDNQDVNKLMAEAYYKADNIDQAKKYIGRALSNSNVTNDTRLLAFYIYETTGKYQDAVNQMDKIIAANPSDPKFIFLKSRAEFRLNKFQDIDKVVSDFRSKNVQIDDDENEAVIIAYQTYAKYKLGKTSEVEALFEKANETFSDNVYVQYLQGLYKFDTNKKSEATVFFDRAKELDVEGDVTKMIDQVK